MRGKRDRTRRLYRVFPWNRGARKGRPGHPLTIASGSQGFGRLDNPDLYGVVYASDSAVGACAEVFGQVRDWDAGMLRISRVGPAALATLALTDDRVLDLDDPRTLLDRGLRPSRVVTRQREITQAWAAHIFAEQAWTGVSWWSFWEPDWTSLGVWEPRALRVVRIEPLTMHTRALVEAADALNRVL